MLDITPGYNCPLCPRLAAFRQENRHKFPDKYNAPVPAFGALDSEFLVLGLAPGLKGANFSGRPFTGDYAGVLLYSTLLKFGFAKGTYDARHDDGLELVNCRITNGVRCVPPENKPTPQEITTCNMFLKNELAAMKNLKIVLTLGLIAHNALLKATGQKISKHKFTHGLVHQMGEFKMINSYHCSRYNTQTNRLTEEMFHDVFRSVLKELNA